MSEGFAALNVWLCILPNIEELCLVLGRLLDFWLEPSLRNPEYAFVSGSVHEERR